MAAADGDLLGVGGDAWQEGVFWPLLGDGFGAVDDAQGIEDLEVSFVSALINHPRRVSPWVSLLLLYRGGWRRRTCHWVTRYEPPAAWHPELQASPAERAGEAHLRHLAAFSAAVRPRRRALQPAERAGCVHGEE